MSFHTLYTLAFFGAFVALVLWMFRPGGKAQYEKLGDIPLDGEMQETTTYRQEEQHG